ncbi:MAG: hypothetical protein HAW62_00960 [Endozoicomonadaceae bacterium]|nr:hypothetical protein [Endozoicomonadaceae bacterium]
MGQGTGGIQQPLTPRIDRASQLAPSSSPVALKAGRSVQTMISVNSTFTSKSTNPLPTKPLANRTISPSALTIADTPFDASQLKIVVDKTAVTDIAGIPKTAKMHSKKYKAFLTSVDTYNQLGSNLPLSKRRDQLLVLKNNLQTLIDKKTTGTQSDARVENLKKVEVLINQAINEVHMILNQNISGAAYPLIDMPQASTSIDLQAAGHVQPTIDINSSLAEIADFSIENPIDGDALLESKLKQAGPSIRGLLHLESKMTPRDKKISQIAIKLWAPDKAARLMTKLNPNKTMKLSTIITQAKSIMQQTFVPPAAFNSAIASLQELHLNNSIDLSHSIDTSNSVDIIAKYIVENHPNPAAEKMLETQLKTYESNDPTQVLYKKWCNIDRKTEGHRAVADIALKSWAKRKSNTFKNTLQGSPEDIISIAAKTLQKSIPKEKTAQLAVLNRLNELLNIASPIQTAQSENLSYFKTDASDLRDNIQQLGRQIMHNMSQLNHDMQVEAQNEIPTEIQQSYDNLPVHNMKTSDLNLMNSSEFTIKTNPRFATQKALVCNAKTAVKNAMQKHLFHANEITMPSGRHFIASQGPKAAEGKNPGNIGQYWNMLANKEVPVSIDLTKIADGWRSRTEYAPAPGQTKTYDTGIVVQNLGESSVMDGKFTIQSLLIDGKPHTRLMHNDFPDKTSGVPSDMIALSLLARQINPDLSKPITVHCTAGIGRTGTLIVAMDQVESQLQGKKSNNLTQAISTFRASRGDKGVQTAGQFNTLQKISENGHNTLQFAQLLE